MSVNHQILSSGGKSELFENSTLWFQSSFLWFLAVFCVCNSAGFQDLPVQGLCIQAVFVEPLLLNGLDLTTGSTVRPLFRLKATSIMLKSSIYLKLRVWSLGIEEELYWGWL